VGGPLALCAAGNAQHCRAATSELHRLLDRAFRIEKTLELDVPVYARPKKLAYENVQTLRFGGCNRRRARVGCVESPSPRGRQRQGGILNNVRPERLDGANRRPDGWQGFSG
jgi:hypothetical protein